MGASAVDNPIRPTPTINALITNSVMSVTLAEMVQVSVYIHHKHQHQLIELSKSRSGLCRHQLTRHFGVMSSVYRAPHLSHFISTLEYHGIGIIFQTEDLCFSDYSVWQFYISQDFAIIQQHLCGFNFHADHWCTLVAPCSFGMGSCIAM